MGTYDAQMALAKTLLEAKGETSTIRRRVDSSGTYDWKPGSPSWTEVEVSAVWLDYDVRERDGNLVQVGDQKVYVAASDVSFTIDPATDVIVRASGETWDIVGVDKLAPNGETILYTLQVRR